MISRRKLTVLRKTMQIHNVHPRTQTALIDGVKGGLFLLETKKGVAFLYLNNRKFEFFGSGLVPTNQPIDRRI